MNCPNYSILSYEEAGAKYLFQSPEYADLTITLPPTLGDITLPLRSATFTLPRDYLVYMKGIIVAPHQILIKDRWLLPDSFRRYNTAHDYLKINADGSYSVETPVVITEVINEPCFYFDTAHIQHYGHFTLEAISRLWCFDKIDLKNFIILTSHPDVLLLFKILKPFGIKIEQIKVITGPTYCNFLVISNQSYVLETSISPETNKIYDKISLYYYKSAPKYKKLYISRTKSTHQRNLLNEEAIEKLFIKKGFTLFHPQTMTIEEQIMAYSNAREIAGCSGSGMYNAIYSLKKEKITILVSKDFITVNDALINSSSKSTIVYLTGTRTESEKSPMLANWTIDFEFVQRYLSG